MSRYRGMRFRRTLSNSVSAVSIQPRSLVPQRLLDKMPLRRLTHIQALLFNHGLHVEVQSHRVLDLLRAAFRGELVVELFQELDVAGPEPDSRGRAIIGHTHGETLQEQKAPSTEALA